MKIRNLLVILAVLFGCTEIAMASGKISFRADSFDEYADQAGPKYSLGINVYEQLMPQSQLVYVGFIGGNLGGDWLKSDQALQYTTNYKVVYGVGVENVYHPKGDNYPNIYYATVGYKLWD